MFENDEIQIDCVIIGGGILGLFCGYNLKKKYPDMDIVILEKNEFLCDETSGRNSGVLHAGIYYQTGTLKHLHSIHGIDLWYKFAKDWDISFNKCGKFIISSEKDDLPRLQEIYRQGLKNGVPGLTEASQSQIDSISDFVKVSEAIYSPNTGVIDVPDAARRVSIEFENLGGIILREHEVENIRVEKNKFYIDCEFEKITTNYLVNCAGTQSVQLRRKLGLLDIGDYFVKGHYLKISPNPKYENLLYPVAPQSLKGLGVHSTLDISGQNRFGPDHVDTDVIDYSMDESVIDKMYPEISRLFKNIEKKNLSLDYCGIRPKIRIKGELFNDFYLGTPLNHGISNYYEFLGIESPGLTSAPSLSLTLLGHI